jgi:hypothetical protein
MTEPDWLAATDPQPMLRFLRSRRQGSDRKLRLFAVACCWAPRPWLTENCCQDAVLTAEKYADGLVGERALARATAAMGPGFRDRHTASLREAVLAETGDRHRAAAASAGWAASWDATRKALRVGASDAAEAASLASWGALTRSAENVGPAAESSPRGRLPQLARDIFGNPFRPAPTLAPAVLAWDGGTVPKLAAATYEERALDRLPVLADALEDAGCTDAAILGHCRAGGGACPRLLGGRPGVGEGVRKSKLVAYRVGRGE